MMNDVVALELRIKERRGPIAGLIATKCLSNRLFVDLMPEIGDSYQTGT